LLWLLAARKKKLLLRPPHLLLRLLPHRLRPHLLHRLLPHRQLLLTRLHRLHPLPLHPHRLLTHLHRQLPLRLLPHLLLQAPLLPSNRQIAKQKADRKVGFFIACFQAAGQCVCPIPDSLNNRPGPYRRVSVMPDGFTAR
jgi:hypothetical protein